MDEFWGAAGRCERVNDSRSVTRGLRRGQAYVLTINGEPLADVIPIKRRRAVSTAEVLAIFANAPVLDLRADLDIVIDQELPSDPLEGTGLCGTKKACSTPISSRPFPG
ncbi:hypothetical protein AB0K60_29175 [Thermopolyspora sp. NPDC052614]|uniref:hypothetical protein n=1 Tax=Thermopolyspora sp. NPDC052614 TaxID=3155682 RepID=UPI003442A99A